MGEAIETWLRAARLEWYLKRLPVQYLVDGKLRTMEDRFVLVRSDTHAALSVVSSDYQIVQPKEVLEFYRELMKEYGYTLETAGALDGGRKVWALARTGLGDAADNPSKLVDALSVLLLIWNGAFYRYGTFDEATAETCLRDNQATLNAFRAREIASFSEADEKETGRLFNLVSQGLARKVDRVESPVSAGKALHLLAATFFPLWDQYIAPAYDCPYAGELASVAYIVFTRKTRAIAAQLTTELSSAGELQKEWLSRKPLLKRIDEYNYMKYTVPAMKVKKDRQKAK